MTLVLELDRDTAVHLALAIRVHRDQLAKRGMVAPAALLELEEMALRSSESSQEPSGACAAGAALHDDLQNANWLSPDDVARVARVSKSSVQRWLRSRRLKSTKVGRLRRIARSDLDEFLQG